MLKRLAPTRFLLAFLLASTLTGCAAGVPPRLAQTDASLAYSARQQKILFEKRAEFDQFVADFLLSRKPVFLAKMEAAVEFTDREVGIARAFLDINPPYQRGIALLRHEAAEATVEKGEKLLCEMLLSTAELHLQCGNPDEARTALDKLRTRFSDEACAGYRKKAEGILEEIGGNTGKNTPEEAPAAEGKG